MKSTIEKEIKHRVLVIATRERQSTCNRIELGRLAVALQNVNGDVDSKGGVSYRPARKKIMAWLGESPEICEKTLELCIYVALRTTAQQIKVLADAGASVSAVHASVQHFDKKNKLPEFARYVADVKRGNAKVGKHLMNKVRAWQTKNRDYNTSIGEDLHRPGSITIQVMDEGEPSISAMQPGLQNLVTLVSEPMLEKALNMAVERCRKSGKELKRWRLE